MHLNIRYLGEDCADYGNLRGLLDGLVGDDDYYYDETRTRKMFYERFSGTSSVASCVYSNEDIMTSAMPSVCAARLKRLLPDAKVVMVIRNQLTTWLSWYANHGAYLKQVPRRYWRLHVELPEWLDYCFMFPKKTPVEAMNYGRFYDIFAKLYGTNNVNVFLYEELLSDPTAYYGRWAELLCIPLNDVLDRVASHRERPRNTARRTRFDRWKARWSWVPGVEVLHGSLGRVCPPLQRWVDSGPSADIFLPDEWKAKIVEYYRDSNFRLAQKTGLDLARAGYPVP